MNLVYQHSFQKLSIFPSYFTQLGKFRGEANVEKHTDPGKQNRNSRKSRENSRNLLEAFLRSRKEENLYGHCDLNNARRILSKGSTLLRGCWFWCRHQNYRGISPTHAPPWGRLSNSPGPVWASMYSDPFSTTTPAGVGIDSPVRVKWKETPKTNPKGLQEEISLWDNLCRSCSCPVSRLCRPTVIDRQLGAHARAWTAADLIS